MATKQREDNDDASTPLFTTDLGLVYKPPRSAFRRFFWRWRICFESTLALSMFEGWEKFLIRTSHLRICCPQDLTARLVALIAIFWGLLITGIYRYLPYHLQFLYRRTVYYLSGTEQKDWTSVRGVGAAVLSTKAPHVFTAEL
jgi:Small subunit of serine palmitoyltransferase-like